MADPGADGSNGPSLLSTRLQRMREGPAISRSRPSQEQSATGRSSIGGPALASILSRQSRESNSPLDRNPFTDFHRPSSSSTSSIYGRSRGTVPGAPSASKKFTPEAPVFEEVQLSGDLMRVREMLKEKGFTAGSSTTQPASRRESLMQRQPALASSFPTFEQPAAPGLLGGAASNGFGFSSGGSSFFSHGNRSPTLLSPPLSPTFDDSDPGDPEILEKKREIESKFQALGTNMESDTSSALDRINRAKRLLEQSKKASETRASAAAERKTRKPPSISEDTSQIAVSPDIHAPVSPPVAYTPQVAYSPPAEYRPPAEYTAPADSFSSRYSRSSSVMSQEGGLDTNRHELFNASGTEMERDTAGAFERINRARKLLEDSKRASEVRLSSSTQERHRTRTPSNSEHHNTVSPSDQQRLSSPAVESNSYVPRYPRSASALSQEGSDATSQEHSTRNVPSRSDFLQSRSKFSPARDKAPLSNGPEDVLNHSESSHFRPIETDYSSRIRQILGQTKADEDVPVQTSSARQSSPPMAHTLPRPSKQTKSPKPVTDQSSKDTVEVKPARTSGYDRPTKSTAAKAVPETKPKPAKNSSKRPVKKLPQIAMFESMGQQKNEDKSVKSFGGRSKSSDPKREKAVQKMLFGKNSEGSETTDLSDATSEDGGRSLDSAELVNIHRVARKFVQEGPDKPGRFNKSGSASPRSKTPRPDSKSSRTDRSSRSSSSDKSGKFSPHGRRKSVAESPSKSRSRKNSPERGTSRSRRNSTSEQSNTPIARRNSIRVVQGGSVANKVTLSSMNKMVDKARSKSKPDLREIAGSKEENTVKPSFRRSKSVGKEGDSPPGESKSIYARKNSSTTTTPIKTTKQKNQLSNGTVSRNSESVKKTTNSPQTNQQQPAEQKTSSRFKNVMVRGQARTDQQQPKKSMSEPTTPVGGWEFIYVGPKEQKSDDVKRLVDVSREVRGVEIEEDDPDVVRIGPGMIRGVLDQYKRPSTVSQPSGPSKQHDAPQNNQSYSSPRVNGEKEAYASKTSDLLDRVAQIKQSIRSGHHAALQVFDQNPSIIETASRQKAGTCADDGEVSEMGGAPIYHSPAFRIDVGRVINPTKQSEVIEDPIFTPRSIDSESTDYDSAVEALSAHTRSVVSTEGDSTSEYNSAAEEFGSDSDDETVARERVHSVSKKPVNNIAPPCIEDVSLSADDHLTQSENDNSFTEGNTSQEIIVNVDLTESDETNSAALTPKPNDTCEQMDLICFDDDVVTPVGPSTPLPLTAAKNVDDILFSFEPEPVEVLMASPAPDCVQLLSPKQSLNASDTQVNSTPQLSNVDILVDVNKVDTDNVDDKNGTKQELCELQGYDNFGFGCADDATDDLVSESLATAEGSTICLSSIHVHSDLADNISEPCPENFEVEKSFFIENNPDYPTEQDKLFNSDEQELSVQQIVKDTSNIQDEDNVQICSNSDEIVHELNSDMPASKQDNETLPSISPDTDKVFFDEISAPEQNQNNSSVLGKQSVTSVASEQSVLSTENDDNLVESEGNKNQSESEVTESVGYSSSASASTSQTPQEMGSSRKKRHRSESKKRRKRKHIEKAAALREAAGTSQTDSPNKQENAGSSKRASRKTQGALLMTNLLVLDMGLTAPNTDLVGEPGAVFLPAKPESLASEECYFSETGSEADDESESVDCLQSTARNNSVSTDTEDHMFYTPEAVSPQQELPQPGFLKTNPFILQDGLPNLNSRTSGDEGPAGNSDPTICAMFRRTLGLLTTKYKDSLSEDDHTAASVSASESLKSTPQKADVKNSPSARESIDEISKSDETVQSPKLARQQKQSFLFHNKFIQEDLDKSKPCGRSPRPRAKVLGRRRHFSSGAGSSWKNSECSDSSEFSPHRAASEDGLDSYIIIDSRECSPASRSISPSDSRSMTGSSTEKPKINFRFVKDNPFFKKDKRKFNPREDLYYEDKSLQKDVQKDGGKSSNEGSLGKALKAGFRKLSFRRGKSKGSKTSSTSTLCLNDNVREGIVGSQAGSVLNSFVSTPCLTESDTVSTSGNEDKVATVTAGDCLLGTANSGAGTGVNKDQEDVVKARVHLKTWNPVKLLETIYSVRLMDETVEDLSHSFIAMEGVMEKLPMGKRKSTLLKTWKRRYFKATDGWLHYYENNNFDKPSHSIQLMGGTVEALDSRILGVDDGRGHYLMVRCQSGTDFENWRVALESQTADNARAVYVRPVLHSPPHPNKRVVIIDIGSTSVRAGVLGEQACLPQLFFPTVVAQKKGSGECVVGFDAYRPEVREQSTLRFPVRPSIKVDKGRNQPFNIDMELLPHVFEKIFKDLKVDCRSHWVLLSTPQMLADKLKGEIMHCLTRRFGVAGVCIAPQSLLAMYSYKATSGIIVDVGERIEILPISDGYIVDGGVTRQPFGGEKVADSLNQYLTRRYYHFFTEVERLIVRHVMEETCYVAADYNEECRQYTQDPHSFLSKVYLNNYDLPAGTYSEVTHDESCFKSAEGLFNTDLWGMDYPKLHKLVHKAIMECPMDNRREMCRSIYLSGGLTMLPRFAERLQAEITKLVPAGLTIQVHASPHRYHAAFIGGCTLAAQEQFEQTCISREQWNKNGTKELKKWHMPS